MTKDFSDHSSGASVDPMGQRPQDGHFRRELARLRMALDMMNCPVVFVELPSLRIVDANRAAQRRLGYPRQELFKRSLNDIAHEAPSEEEPGSHRDLVASLRREETRYTTCVGKGGSTIPVELEVRYLHDDVEPVAIVALHDVSDRQPIVDLPRPGAFRDVLTELPNRGLLEIRLIRAWNRVRELNDSFAALMIDIDHFKHVNDTWGHAAGDFVLKTVSRRLTKCIRPHDVIARYGGDEFVALIEAIGSQQEAVGVARRMSGAIRAAIHRDGHPDLHISASIGVSLSTSRHADIHQWIHEADRAMYDAKGQGRCGKVVVWTELGE